MPSFFSKKTRSQQAAGESPSSSASTVAGAVPPSSPSLTVPLPDDSYQLHLHQRPNLLSDSLDARFNLNPSESYSSYGVPRPHSPHSPHPATTEPIDPIDLRYGQNLDPQQQQQQHHHHHQQNQQYQQYQYQHHEHQQQLPPAPPLQPPYRHPAHTLPSQLSLDRPSISLVTASTDVEPDSSNQPNLNSDHRTTTTTTTTTTTQGSSPKSLSTSKLQKKKKGLFNRDIAADTTTPATTKQPKSLARSASIKHSFGRGLDKDTSVSILPPSAEYESIVTPSAAAATTTTTITTTTTAAGILDPHSPSRPSQGVETESSSRPPTGGEIPPSPGWQYTSSSSRLPPTPQSEYPHSSRELTGPDFDRNEVISQHGRSESLESIESQALLHPHVSSAVGDMSTTKQSDTTPTRKNSLAAPSSTPYGSIASQPSFKNSNSSQQNLTDMQGRETPPSAQMNSKLREELETLDVGALIQRHVELQSKYQRVKRYYFEKDAQVTQLQNTVAHQRMAVSRTVLDDNEYTARFVRLDGAIKQLAFSIRKDWRSVPEWLHPYVNQDAVTAGSKEMTAVGRAVISRWVVDEIFNRYFHPGLDRGLSERLKIIELNLRRQQFQVFNDDDKENQVARISNWRRTTLDGLVDQLQSKPTLDNLNQLAEYLVEKLSAALQCSLKEPAPPELDHIARTIVENAINIAEKIPQEARDIVVDYVVPGSFVSESNMRVETGLPALTRSMAQVADLAGEMTDDGMEIDNKDSIPAGATSPSSPSSQQHQQIDQQQGKSAAYIPQNRDQRKKYPFGNLISKKTASPASQPMPSHGQSGDDNTGNNGRDEPTPSQQQQQQQEQSQEKRARVRLATFMTVEVKGRGPNNVLVPAPVYTLDQ